MLFSVAGMEMWPEFASPSSWGREFVAGGFGGIAGIISGYPLDTLRIHQQRRPPSSSSSAFSLLRSMVANDGLSSLYRGMAAPLASVALQTALVFQTYALLSRAFDAPAAAADTPPSLRAVALGGVGTGALQSMLVSPVELVKIRLQLKKKKQKQGGRGRAVGLAMEIMRREGGVGGLYRGLSMTVARDAPGHGIYFVSYEWAREWLEPGCRRRGGEKVGTMAAAGGVAGVASWVGSYPLDVVKTRMQASMEYKGVADCVWRSVGEEGLGVLWRGLGTAVARAFVVNGFVFTAYEIALRCMPLLSSSSSNPPPPPPPLS